MNRNIDSETCFNDIAKDLTLERYYVLLLPFPFHGLGNDFGLVVFFVMFPKVVDDPEVDEQFQKDEAMTNYLRSVSKSLVQDWIKFIDLKKKFEMDEGFDPLESFRTLWNTFRPSKTFWDSLESFRTLYNPLGCFGMAFSIIQDKLEHFRILRTL